MGEKNEELICLREREKKLSLLTSHPREMGKQIEIPNLITLSIKFSAGSTSHNEISSTCSSFYCILLLSTLSTMVRLGKVVHFFHDPFPLGQTNGGDQEMQFLWKEASANC